MILSIWCSGRGRFSGIYYIFYFALGFPCSVFFCSLCFWSFLCFYPRYFPGKGKLALFLSGPPPPPPPDRRFVHPPRTELHRPGEVWPSRLFYRIGACRLLFFLAAAPSRFPTPDIPSQKILAPLPLLRPGHLAPFGPFFFQPVSPPPLKRGAVSPLPPVPADPRFSPTFFFFFCVWGGLLFGHRHPPAGRVKSVPSSPWCFVLVCFPPRSLQEFFLVVFLSL